MNKPVFDRLGTYGFVHHRALNSFTGLETALATARAWPNAVHVMEGDICWNFRGGREDLYFRHPALLFDVLGSGQIDRRVAARRLVRLEDTAALVPDNVLLIVELKVGRGDRQAAFAKMLSYLETHFPRRYWIDGFSLKLLREIQAERPETPVTLHTEFLRAGRALLLAPEWPLVRLSKVQSLERLDGIAIRWHGSAATMERSAAAVTDTDQRLILSRLHDQKRFEASVRWGAAAGYVYGDFANLTSTLARLRAKAGASS